MVIRPINQGDVKRLIGQYSSGIQSGEAAANDYDFRVVARILSGGFHQFLLLVSGLFSDAFYKLLA